MTVLPVPVAVSLVGAGGSFAWFGTRMVWSTRARGAGALFAACSVALVAAVAARNDVRAAEIALLFGVQVLAVAVMSFPTVDRDWATGLAVAVELAAPGLLWWAWGTVDAAALALLLGLVPLLQVWWRLESSDQRDRLALAWLLVAVGPLALIGAAVAFMDAPPGVLAAVVALFAVIPWAAWRGATDARRIDVRAIASALAVNGIAFIAVLTLFETATTGMRALGGPDRLTPTTAIVAAACCFAFEPIRRQLRGVADEILFGQRPDPVVAAARVASGIGEDTTSALDAIISALRLPFAELRLDGLPPASVGVRPDHVAEVPVLIRQERVGELIVGLRPGDLRLSTDDVTVLSLGAPLVAQTMQSRALAASLQQAREVAAEAREEERRRLRRDLHDGLGPRLSGIAFRADAARLALNDAAAEHLNLIRSEAAIAIREIRELVYGLRPPALDELGLLEAMRVQAGSLVASDGRPMRITVEADDLPSLPAAVEVAVYRIAMEGLTNSARHSGQDLAHVRIAVDGDFLLVTVTDAGSSSSAWTAGVGLSAMRERAAELGGSVAIEAGVIRARLPLRPSL